MKQITNLKPNYRRNLIIGPTGAGKTEFAIIPGTPAVRKILREGVGRTNTTLVPRSIVFTTEYTDTMLVAVTRNKEAFSRNAFSELTVNALAEMVRVTGRTAGSDKDQECDALKAALEEELFRGSNTKAVMSLLEEDKRQLFVDAIVTLYRSLGMGTSTNHIYMTARNNAITDGDTRISGNKLMGAIRHEVADALEKDNGNFKNGLWSIWGNIDSALDEVFFSRFNRDECSEDGYYYREVSVNNPDGKFINAMFSANNIEGGGHLSLEVLCGEIVIYAPMNPAFSKMIEEDPLVNEVYKDSYGHTVFENFDTRGLYHANNTDDENAEYAADLVYQGGADGITAVIPMEGDTNEKKVGDLLRRVLQNYKRQAPLIVVRSKLDLLVDSMTKSTFYDPLMDELDGEVLPDGDEASAEIEKEIIRRTSEFGRTISPYIYRNYRKMPEINQVPCYLMRNRDFPEDIAKKYSVSAAYRMVLRKIAESLKDRAHKVVFSTYEETPTLSVDEDVLKELVHIQVTESSITKKVFDPGLSNLQENLGKTPHGNSYNALRRRLMFGDGYKSDIDESYYYNCQSFDIHFTGNLRNFATSEFLHNAVYRSLSIEGAEAAQEVWDTFVSLVEKNVDVKRFVGILLYHKAILPAEKKAFSFQAKFNRFLSKSEPYFTQGAINEEAFVEALSTVLLEAANRVMDLNVAFV